MDKYKIYTLSELIYEPSSYLEVQESSYTGNYIKQNSIYFDIEDFDILTFFISITIPEYKNGGICGVTVINLEKWLKIYEDINDFINILVTEDFYINFLNYIKPFNYLYFKKLDELLKKDIRYRFEFINFLYQFLSWVNTNYIKYNCFSLLGV